MKKFLSIILSITMLFSMVTVAFADGIDGTMKKEQIKVGTSADFKPFEYYDENGELTGFDIDLMNYVGERIGFDIEFVNMSFDKLIPAVISGEVDCAISCITVTEERDSIIDYSREYLKTYNISFDENGKRSTKHGEQYAIVFREGLAGSPYEELSEPTGDETLYILIDKALRELSNDRTVLKLIKKYELNKPLDESTVNVEYSAIMGGGDPGAKAEDSEPITSATSIEASEWAWAEIDKAHALNITNAGGNYNFPGAINREQFCELVYNYISEFGNLAVDDGHIVFVDTDNTKIRILNTMGIIKGKSATQFAPNDLLTREEAATILERLINVVHPGLGTDTQYITFADSADISDWAMSSIQTIYKLGIMQGVGNNKFAPQENYTTEQAIVTLVRVYANSGVSKSDNALISDDILFADKVNAQMPTDKNYMFSPMSIKMALALAANGASGETQEQILNALGLANLDEFNTLSKDLIARYSQTDILKLNIANSIWMNKDKTSQNYSDAFKKTATDFYDAEVKSITNSNAVKEINGWVSDKTNGKIPAIIQNADDFWAMLINAIYFKGAWLNEFSVNATKPDQFNNADGTKISVDFMNKTKWFPYVETKSVKMIELPYQNRIEKFSDDGEYLDTEVYNDLDVSMYLIMPEGDINVEQELSAAIIDNAFKSTYIKMAMPKFKIEYSTDLNDIFMNMGITTAFDKKNADFTKMFDKGNMWFTRTIHKTFIDVDEKGTEAAAVTAIGMAGSSLPPEPIELKFNKPFYFAIRDNTSGETLFMGRYAFAN